MKLRTEHKGVRAFGQLGYLHEAAVGRFTGKYETRFLEALDVLGIYLEAVAVALANELRAASFELRGRCVGLLCYGAGDELARIRTQAHGAAVIFLCEFFYLLRKNCDDGMRTLRVYLGRMGAREACDIARIFDGHELHAIAEPEVRDFILPHEADGVNLALNPRLAESAGNDDAVVFLELGDGRGIALVIFCIEPINLRLYPMHVGGKFDGFDDGNVRVGEHEIARIEIFADDTDFHCAVAVVRVVGKTFPFGKIRRLLRALAEQAHQGLGELVALEIEGHVVNGIHVGRRDDVVGLHVAPDGELLFAPLVERVRGARDDDVGLDAVGIKLAYGIL